MTTTFARLSRSLQDAIAAVDRTEITNLVWQLTERNERLKAQNEMLVGHIRHKNEQIKALQEQLDASVPPATVGKDGQ